MAKSPSTQNNDRRVETQKKSEKSSDGNDERFTAFILSARLRFVNGKIVAKPVKDKILNGAEKIGGLAKTR